MRLSRSVWRVGVAAAVLVVGAARGAESVRVDASGGAPRVVVDGRPVRARMFWGAPGTRPLPVPRGGGEVRFEFVASQDVVGAATMHLRFGAKAGRVEIDDLVVTDLDDGGKAVVGPFDFEAGEASLTAAWVTWPIGPENTVGRVEVAAGAGRAGTAGMRVTLTAPPGGAAGRWPDFHIYHRPTLTLRKGHRYRVSLWAKAEPEGRELTVAFYRPGRTFVLLGGPDNGFEAQVALAREAGARFVSFPVTLPWPRPGERADYAAVDAAVERALATAGPEMLLIPRIPCDPPRWWVEAHPEAAMTWDRPAPVRGAVAVASEAYRREAAEHLAALVRHLEAKHGPRMAGYHPCGQNTGEWFYHDTWGPGWHGYSRAELAAFRRWLAARYADDAALRAAWGDEKVTRETATVPPAEARRARAPAAGPLRVLRDPAAERAVLDFAAFQQEAMADCVRELARAVRTASGGKKLVLFFYGYSWEFAAVGTEPAISGHYAMRRVLEYPDVDVLCSPISYFDRGLGQGGPAMSAAESVALAGKMWLSEDDTHTHLATGDQPGSADHVATAEDAAALLLRNAAQCGARNFGTWWMDLGMTGWFNDARLWEPMRRLEAMERELLERPRAFRPEVAASIDEASMLRVAAGGNAAVRPLVYESRRALGRAGLPYGQYLLDDVMAGRVGGAKVHVMLSAWALDAAQRKRLAEATRGTVRVWCYAPGYHDGPRTSLEAMGELTGFEVRRIEGVRAWAEPTEAGRRLGLTSGLGVRREIAPLFTVADAKDDEVLARYANGAPAVALRATGDGGASLFVGPPGLTSELVRLAAKRGGAHVYVDGDCHVWANGPYVVLHGAGDGAVEVNVRGEGVVRDLMSGQVVGRGARVRVELGVGRTRVLEVR